MARSWMLKIALAVFALTLAAGSADAWIITQTVPNPGSGLAEATVFRFDTQAGQDLFEIHKYYLPDFEPSVMSLELKFQREAGDQDTIRIVDELILNMTGAEWHDYHVALWSEDSSDQASFINPSVARAVRQWGGAHLLGWTPSSADFTQIDWAPASKDPLPPGWAGVPSGTFADAPANQLMITGLKIDVSQLEEGDVFYLKQWPTVPEPSTLSILLALSVPAMLRRFGRRRRGTLRA